MPSARLEFIEPNEETFSGYRHTNPDGTAGGWVAENATIGDGAYIEAGALVGPGAVIAAGQHVAREPILAVEEF